MKNKKKCQTQDNKLKLTLDKIARQVLQGKLDVNTHCVTESATMDENYRDRLAHADETVGESINSRQHKTILEKKLTTVVAKLLGAIESKLAVLFNKIMKEFLSNNNKICNFIITNAIVAVQF